jgi:hypothetical protein
MRYRVYGISGCLGEFQAYRYELISKKSLKAFVSDGFYYIGILYQEPIVSISDDHGRLDYIEALGKIGE